MNLSNFFPKFMGVGALACALLLGGCAGDEDNGGGGTKIAKPPTARPSLTGMTVRFDVSGGSATSGNTAGRNGGQVQFVPVNGRLVQGAAAAPAINNNFLTTAVLGDNNVTFAELSAINAANFELVGTTANFDLFGFDFYLPAGATLNLGDAVSGTVDTIVIRTHGPSDYIRIDGTIVTTRSTANPNPALSLVTGLATGTAISVNGSINANGGTTTNGGAVQIQSQLGVISFGGTFTAIGGSSATPGTGGTLGLGTTGNDIRIAAGMIQANGGAGSGTGNGGNGGGGAVFGNFDGSFGVRFGLRANGGASTGGVGGNGGTLQLLPGDIVDLFVPVELNGGPSTNATGGNGGTIIAKGSFVRGVLAGTLNGGNGSNTGAFLGGNGGTAQIGASAFLQSLAIDLALNGGSGTTGGDGGAVQAPSSTLFDTMGVVDQVLFDIDAMGGTGVNLGGDGGDLIFIANDSVRNLTLRGNMSGGNATSATGTGGDGGQVGAGNNVFGHDVQDILFDVTLDGGDALAGSSGGDGGVVQVVGGIAGIGSFPATVNGTANGGDGVSFGGQGGAIIAQANVGQNWLTLGFTANGGAASNGVGGQGGAFQTGGSNASARLTGSFTAMGGTSNGAGNDGGAGGGVLLGASGLAKFEITNLTINLTGGSSTGGDGGQGGVINSNFACVVVINSGTFITNGGVSTAAMGFGGEAGDQTWASDNFDMRMGGTYRAIGGNGSVGGGDGGDIEFTPDLGDNGPGAYILFTGTAESMGGNATTSGNGGDGGSIQIDNYDTATDFSFAGVSEFRGNWNASGGNGAGATSVGGTGGYCDVDTNGDAVIVNGTIRSNGGTGVTGGQGGPISLYADDDGTIGFTTISVAGLIEANGGVGTTTGGDGGSIGIAGDDADVTFSGTVTVNGGSGPTGGDAGSINFGGTNDSATVTLTASARVRANGGATNGDGGMIVINPQGTGGTSNTNIVEQAGRVVEALANGTGAAGTITRD